jgi:hypothetical protein
MEQENQRFLKLLDKVSHQQEMFRPQRAVVAYLPLYLLTTDGTNVEEASKLWRD